MGLHISTSHPSLGSPCLSEKTSYDVARDFANGLQVPLWCLSGRARKLCAPRMLRFGGETAKRKELPVCTCGLALQKGGAEGDAPGGWGGLLLLSPCGPVRVCPECCCGGRLREDLIQDCLGPWTPSSPRSPCGLGRSSGALRCQSTGGWTSSAIGPLGGDFAQASLGLEFGALLAGKSWGRETSGRFVTDPSGRSHVRESERHQKASGAVPQSPLAGVEHG